MGMLPGHYLMRPKWKSKLGTTATILPPDQSFSLADGHLIGSSGGGPYVLNPTEDSILYTTSSGKIRRSNMCVHTKKRRSIAYAGQMDLRGFTPSVPTVKLLWSGYVQYGDSAQTSAINAFRTAAGQSKDTVLKANANSYMSDGLSRMKPDLTEVSVPNFLWEIGQISSLWRIWDARRSFLPNVAGAHLNLSFGWKPTIGDCLAMVSSVTSFQKKLHDWIDSVGKVVSKRVTIMSRTFNSSGALVGVPFSGGTTNWRGTLTGKVTAHIKYRPLPIKELIEVNRVLFGLLDSLGFELNPRILWEAVPFSFVVDWFIGIGKWLERLKIDTLELPIKLEDNFLQYKESVEVSSWVLDDSNFNYQHPIAYPGVTSHEEFFHRLPYLPEPGSYTSLGWHMPNTRQVILGLALGIQRIVK